ncbi:histone acetyltransferase KAT6B [Caerostris extrusa]|uniref:Histone acetyltransferase KAT6B n=1 Tax=Caerostris extrusa TaxID=172846 RepID=A0AAV4Y4U3_CAEEX|nr:histone acetyltransferase KAT6B [Caerostris extrusa]
METKVHFSYFINAVLCQFRGILPRNESFPNIASGFSSKTQGTSGWTFKIFTPTNKRKSRVAISSLGDSLALDEDIQGPQPAASSFSGTRLCDQTFTNRTKHSDLLTESKLQINHDLSTQPSANNSSPSSLNVSSASTSLNLLQSVKPSSSGQLKKSV